MLNCYYVVKLLTGLPIMQTNVTFWEKEQIFFSWVFGLLEKYKTNQPNPFLFQLPPQSSNYFVMRPSVLRQCLGGRTSLSITGQAVWPCLLRNNHFLIYLPLPLHAGRIAFHCGRTHLSKVEKERVLPKILQLLVVSVDKEDSPFFT